MLRRLYTVFCSHKVSWCDISLFSLHLPFIPRVFHYTMLPLTYTNHSFSMQLCLVSLAPLTLQKGKECAIYITLHLLFTFPPISLHLRSAPIPLHFSLFCFPFPLFLLILPLVSVSALIFCNYCHYVWVVHLFSQENQALEYVYFCDYTYTTCCGKNVITNSESVAVHPCFISRAAQTETLLFGRSRCICSARQEHQFLTSLENSEISLSTMSVNGNYSMVKI